MLRNIAVVSAAATLAALVPLMSAGASASTSVPLDRSYQLDRIIKDPRITQSSGLTRSTYPRRLLWTHNDTGGVPRIYGVSRRGTTRAALRVAGAPDNVDFEDIAAGPKHTLWVGDIGDDQWNRPSIDVYRVAEPHRLRHHAKTLKSIRYQFTYPAGPRNAEALMVQPRTGQLYVVSKMAGGAAVYAAPRQLSRTHPNVLTRVADAPAQVTGGSSAPTEAGWS